MNQCFDPLKQRSVSLRLHTTHCTPVTVYFEACVPADTCVELIVYVKGLFDSQKELFVAVMDGWGVVLPSNVALCCYHSLVESSRTFQT